MRFWTDGKCIYNIALLPVLTRLFANNINDYIHSFMLLILTNEIGMINYDSFLSFTCTYEPPRDKTNILTCAPSEDSDQPGFRPVWSESSLCAQWVAKDPSFLHADSEDSDKTGRMPRLIWVFVGRTCYFVGFVTRRLIYFDTFLMINLKWIILIKM